MDNNTNVKIIEVLQKYEIDLRNLKYIIIPLSKLF